MDDLIAFVKARLDEDEAAARGIVAAFGGVDEWVIGEHGEFDYTVTAGQLATEGVADIWREDAAEWIARHDPARVLRDVAADRKLLAELEHAATADFGITGEPYDAGWYGALEMAVRIRAERFSNHPDYPLPAVHMPCE